MKFILEVEECKVVELMAILDKLPYVETTPLTPYKAQVLEDVKEAADELKLVLAGKLEARDADELLS